MSSWEETAVDVAGVVCDQSIRHASHCVSVLFYTQKSTTLRRRGRLASPSRAESPCGPGSTSCVLHPSGSWCADPHSPFRTAVSPMLIFVLNMFLVNAS